MDKPRSPSTNTAAHKPHFMQGAPRRHRKRHPSISRTGKAFLFLAPPVEESATQNVTQASSSGDVCPSIRRDQGGKRQKAPRPDKVSNRDRQKSRDIVKNVRAQQEVNPNDIFTIQDVNPNDMVTIRNLYGVYSEYKPPSCITRPACDKKLHWRSIRDSDSQPNDVILAVWKKNGNDIHTPAPE